MDPRTIWTSLLLLLVLAPIPAQEYADFYEQLLTLSPPEDARNTGLTIFPILAFPTGAEQQALAGAYTAMARDSGYFEANPAASALLDQTQVGIYHANVIADVNLDTLVGAVRWGDLGFGGMAKFLHTPFTAYRIDGEQVASSYYLESVLGLNLSYAFLRNYYFSGLAVGANIKVAGRSIPEVLYDHLGMEDARSQSVVGIMADLGLLMRFDLLKTYVSRDRNFGVGLTLRNLGPPALEDPLPSAATLGLSWSPFRFLVITGDITQPVNLTDLGSSEPFGFAAGTALQFTDFLSVKGGFGFRGGNPRFSLGSDLALQGVDLGLTYTLDYTTQLRIPDHLGIQVRFKLGDEGRLDLRKRVDSLYIDALVALSAADYPLVIKLCEEALALDPGYSPARDTLTLARQSQELIDKIEAIRLDEASVE